MQLCQCVVQHDPCVSTNSYTIAVIFSRLYTPSHCNKSHCSLSFLNYLLHLMLTICISYPRTSRSSVQQHSVTTFYLNRILLFCSAYQCELTNSSHMILHCKSFAHSTLCRLFMSSSYEFFSCLYIIRKYSYNTFVICTDPSMHHF